jgi:RNA polymerase sigma-70 factor (ECF subfamily)
MNPAAPDWNERNRSLAAALARVALGDRAAFARLYDLCSAQLFGVILRINTDRAQAEDVLQECFVSIWRAARSFDAARAQPMPWLTSIARNGAIDSLRRRRGEVPTVSRWAAAGDDGDDDVDMLSTVPSPDAGPLDLLERAAQSQALEQCIDRLSAEQQQCLALAYYQGLSHSEVAQHLVQPLGTVKSWVRRALMALKDCLGRAATDSLGH